MNHSLSQVRDLVKNTWAQLKWEVTDVTTNANFKYITGSSNIREAVVVAETLGLFEQETKALQASQLFASSNDKIRVTVVESKEIDGLTILLDRLFEGLKLALEQVMPQEKPNSINIKLPPVNDFDELSKYSRDLHLALTQVLYLDEVNSSVKIESVENGSIWLNVLIEGAIGLSIVGSLVWAGAVIYKKVLEGKMMEQQLRTLSIRADSMEDVRKAQTQSLTMLLEAEAEHINSVSFKKNVPDNLNRIKNSIELFASLLDKGAEIHPAIGAPEEISNLYPSMKALPTIESKIKRLSQ
jgi:hypothetical protein